MAGKSQATTAILAFNGNVADNNDFCAQVVDCIGRVGLMSNVFFDREPIITTCNSYYVRAYVSFDDPTIGSDQIRRIFELAIGEAMSQGYRPKKQMGFAKEKGRNEFTLVFES